MQDFTSKFEKHELLTMLRDEFPKRAVQNVDGEWLVVGKFCQVAPLADGQWDVWLCNPKNLTKGLSTQRINKIIFELGLDASFVTRLDREAIIRPVSTDLLLTSRVLLGIAKKRQLTEEQMQGLVQRMKQIREKQIEGKADGQKTAV